MGTDDTSKPYDELSELLKKYYKPSKELSQNEFWEKVSKKINTLFHKELFSEKHFNDEGVLLSDEERYWMGLGEYISNEVPSLKHKTISEHLLSCKECMKNYTDVLDKKKELKSCAC